jgi:hypothetical protein
MKAISIATFLTMSLLGFSAPVSARTSGSSGQTNQAAPSVEFTVVQEYRLSVFGSHWLPGRKVTFTLTQPALSQGLELRVNKEGNFLVGINNVDVCAGETANVRDFYGHRASAKGPGLECPPRQPPPVPVLTVLAGDPEKIDVTHIDLFHGRQSADIILGHALYLWEEQGSGTTWLPNVDTTYLQLIASGQTPPRMCPEIECGQGLFWEYVGMKVGRTAVTLVCGGGQVCPQNDLALSIPVTILSGPPAVKPALRFTAVPGYRISIAGSGWLGGSLITFTASEGTIDAGLVLRATKRGGFVVGINNIDPCAGIAFEARDFSGDHFTLPGPALGCVSPYPLPTPVLKVVKGHAVTISVKHVDGTGNRHPVVIRLGDAVYVWESGSENPSLVPSVRTAYFQLIGKGQTLARRCSKVECAAGFFWEWVGMKVGKTTIALEPACAAAKPPCLAPVLLIPVRIKARHG